MKTLLIVVLVGIFTVALFLDWALNVLPVKELHRRARSEPKDHTAKHVYDLLIVGWPGRALNWLAVTVSAAVLFAMALKESYWLAAFVAMLIGLAVAERSRLGEASGWQWKLAGYKAKALVWLFGQLQPALGKLPATKPYQPDTRLYELEDLLDLLGRQPHKPGNRIGEEDLQTAKASLTFSAKKVSQVTVPMKDVRIVLPNEDIGPHMMDELYATGYATFPVGKKVGKKLPPELSGVVYLDDLVAESLKAKASDVMINEIHSIGQDRSLTEVLETFLKWHCSLLVVVDEREEAIGGLWLEDVLAQLLGRKVTPEADNPADADERQKVVE